MNAAEVIESEPTGDSAAQWFSHFLLKVVRESREATIAHAGTEIRTLHNRGIDIGIGLPVDWDLFHGRYFCGAVPAFAFAGGAVDLDELSEASKPIMQGGRDRGFVRRESVRRDLESRARSSLAKSFNEDVGCTLIALADSDIQTKPGGVRWRQTCSSRQGSDRLQAARAFASCR